MKDVNDEREAIQAIIKIIRDQKKLEKHQRAKRASVNTLQDSMVYAYDQIVEIIQPFTDADLRAGRLVP
jgi:hypothetical protein